MSEMCPLDRELEPDYRLIVETSNEGIWLGDHTGRTTFVNAKIRQLLGFTRSEMLGQPISAFFHNEGPHPQGAHFTLPDAQSGPIAGERCFRRKDRPALWTDTTIRAIVDAEGNVTGVIATISDATERREMRVALTDSERRYRLLTEAMPHIVLICDSSGENDYQNQAWYTYSGLTSAQTRNKGWLSIVHPDDVARSSATWTDAIARGEPHETQLRLRRASDGMNRWFVSRATPVRGNDGTIVLWTCSFIDIHDFKLASETRDVLDHLGHMIAVRDADDRLEYISPSWGNFAGTIEAVNLSRRRGDFVHPDDLHIVDELARASHEAPLQIQQNEVRVRAADGSYRWFLTRSVVLPESGEAPKRRLNTLTDIDDLKRAQAALAQSAAELSHRARHDPLTNLANRTWLIDRLAELVGEAKSAGTGVVVVLYLDIDHFKTINDTFGHDAGDAVLIQTAVRIRTALRSGDIASRFGGDEFVLACAATDAADVAQIAERIQTAVRVPVEFAGRRVAIAYSIGISVFPDTCLEADGLIPQADAAMYVAKQNGRNSWCLYSAPVKHAEVQSRISATARLPATS